MFQRGRSTVAHITALEHVSDHYLRRACSERSNSYSKSFATQDKSFEMGGTKVAVEKAQVNWMYSEFKTLFFLKLFMMTVARTKLLTRDFFVG